MLEECVYPYTSRCPKDVHSFSPGFKGERADKTKFMVVANRADQRVLKEPEQLVFNQNLHKVALMKSRTGIILARMLQHSGLDYEDIYFTNAFKCLLSDSREPSNRHYRQCAFNLARQIQDFDPKAILVLGYQAYKAMFPKEAKWVSLEEVAESEKTYNSIPCLILNHPAKMMNTQSLRKRKSVYERVSQFLWKNNII